MNEKTEKIHPNGCGGVNRRIFLADCGMGFTGLVLGAMLQRDGSAFANTPGVWTPPDGKPHFAPKAKSVIWLFMMGGVSHVDTFDPKPALNKYAGKSIIETPYKEVLTSPFAKNFRLSMGDDPFIIHNALFPMQVGHQKRGQSGIEITDWWPQVGKCIDDIALVRSLYTTDNNHTAELQFHTGRHISEGLFPSIGAWVHYGLGSLNDNLPQFVVLGEPTGQSAGGIQLHGSNYLGPEHSGVRLDVNPEKPLPYAFPESDISDQEQKREFELIERLNRLAAVEYPDDPAMRARIKSYELAFRMQMAVPEVVRFEQENEAARQLYGLDQEVTKPFGQVCLTARRLVERGVRFVQVYHGYKGGCSLGWDSHGNLKKSHSELCAQVDQPIAGLLQDLKQRGLLEETLVVWATEFGRSPGIEIRPKEPDIREGRNHHPFGFSAWMGGGGIKGGVVHGATDEVGFHAVEHRHYVTDIHATVLHQLGLDPRKLEIPGRKRLEIDFGDPIHEIIA